MIMLYPILFAVHCWPWSERQVRANEQRSSFLCRLSIGDVKWPWCTQISFYWHRGEWPFLSSEGFSCRFREEIIFIAPSHTPHITANREIVVRHSVRSRSLIFFAFSSAIFCPWPQILNWNSITGWIDQAAESYWDHFVKVERLSNHEIYQVGHQVYCTVNYDYQTFQKS